METVHNIHATLDVQLDALRDFCDRTEDELPPGIVGLEYRRRDSIVEIVSEPAPGTVDRYTPTARIKGTRVTQRVVCDDDGVPTTERVSEAQLPREWDEEERPETVEVEYVRINGRDDAVLYNTALKLPMFELLCQLAVTSGVRGHVEGIVARDGELTPIRVTPDGEEPVELFVASPESDREAGSADEESPAVNWASNPYI